MITIEAVKSATLKFFKQEEPVPFDFGLERLQQLNEEKRKASIAQLGDKWLLHPSHTITKPERNE